MNKSILLILMLIVQQALAQSTFYQDHARGELKRFVIEEAEKSLHEQPITITSYRSTRSAGGIHDFYSEGDYWWPDPMNPNGPYIQRDGETNPDNFVAHRKVMIRFSSILGALASAYILTGDEKYAQHAFEHARAWLIDTASKMNPHMLFAQAIQGRVTGRGIGIIDMIQFMEVAQALIKLEQSTYARKQDYIGYRKWFSTYLDWVTTHAYGIDEKNALNNHGTCWTLQVASFARFTHDSSLIDTCKNRYKYQHLPDQMALDGSFPKELARTKPFGYSLFNLDAMSMLCQVLSDQKDNLWRFETADHKSIQKGISFLYPYVVDKKAWPYKKDVMYWENWPVAHPFLLFGSIQFNQHEYYDLWKFLDHNPQVEEVIRNLPIRHPIIWF